MSRQRRFTEPGQWHHVTNRGIGRRHIFRRDDDRERFLRLLGEMGSRWGVWPVAYSLVPNQFDVLVHDEYGLLSRGMRHVAGVYTQRFNRQYGMEGPVLRGRFRSRIVQHGRHVVEMIRFIHLRPVWQGVSERAGDHRWTSHRVYLGLEDRPWLRVDLVADLLGLDRPGALDALDAFVHEEVSQTMRQVLMPRIWAPALGDPAFVRAVRTRLVEAEGTHAVEQRYDPALAVYTVDAVIDAACTVFHMPREHLLVGRRGIRNTPRLLTILACRDLTPATGREIGQAFGIHPVTVSVLSQRARRSCVEDPVLEGDLERLKDQVRSVPVVGRPPG